MRNLKAQLDWTKSDREKKRGPTETRTRIGGFKVHSDSHYTIGPAGRGLRTGLYKVS
jgi:hypothetical protein